MTSHVSMPIKYSIWSMQIPSCWCHSEHLKTDQAKLDEADFSLLLYAMMCVKRVACNRPHAHNMLITKTTHIH